MTETQETKKESPLIDLSKLNLEDIASKLSMVAIGVKTADSVMKRDPGALSPEYVRQTGEYVFGQKGFSKIKTLYENLLKPSEEEEETQTHQNQNTNSRPDCNQLKQIECVEYTINGKKYRGGILAQGDKNG